MGTARPIAHEGMQHLPAGRHILQPRKQLFLAKQSPPLQQRLVIDRVREGRNAFDGRHRSSCELLSLPPSGAGTCPAVEKAHNTHTHTHTERGTQPRHRHTDPDGASPHLEATGFLCGPGTRGPAPPSGHLCPCQPMVRSPRLQDQAHAGLPASHRPC